MPSLVNNRCVTAKECTEIEKNSGHELARFSNAYLARKPPIFSWLARRCCGIAANRDRAVSITESNTQVTPGLQGITVHRHVADVASHLFQRHIVDTIDTE